MDHPGQDWRWRRVEGWLWGSPAFRSSTEGKEIGKEQPVSGDQNQKSFRSQKPVFQIREYNGVSCCWESRRRKTEE